MAKLDLGKVKGSTWYAGDGITGTSTTPTVYSGSGVTYALSEDLYLNTTGADRANVYQCTLEGDADTALWVYVTSIKGDAVEVVNNLNSDSTTKALSAKMGKELYNLMKTAGIYPLCVTPTISDTSYTASLVVKDVNSTFTVTDMDGNQGTYSHTSQGGDTATVIITIGTSIGLPNNGAVIKTIESSDAEIFSYELYDNTSTLIYSEEPNLWKHITDDELNILPYTSITEGGNTYKSGLISKIISAVRTTLYPVTHAKAVWFNQAASKTMNDFVEDNIDPIEETSTASQSYTVGEHLIYGGIRYIVSSAITAGDTLTPGTNIDAMAIGDEIEQINTDLSYYSTEHKTGAKWTDGKDIYRKCYTLTSPSTENVIDATLSNSYIDTLVSVKGSLVRNNDGLILNLPWLSYPNYCTADIRSTGLIYHVNGITASSVNVIVEYTKA
jgi:hypothetical protein